MALDTYVTEKQELVIIQFFNPKKLKKRQIELGLEILDKLENKKSNKDFLEICKLVDKFKELNYSKKRKITNEIVSKFLSP